MFRALKSRGDEEPFANGMVRPCSCPVSDKLARGAQTRSTPCLRQHRVAAIGTGDGFAKGRDFAAWLGLVPRQISTGDRTILGKISKRGNRYLRVLFVQAAWVVLVKVKPNRWEGHGLKPWIEAAKKRLHHNVLAVALANKLARIAWSVLARGRAFEASNDSKPRDHRKS